MLRRRSVSRVSYRGLDKRVAVYTYQVIVLNSTGIYLFCHMKIYCGPGLSFDFVRGVCCSLCSLSYRCVVGGWVGTRRTRRASSTALEPAGQRGWYRRWYRETYLRDVLVHTREANNRLPYFVLTYTSPMCTQASHGLCLYIYIYR